MATGVMSLAIFCIRVNKREVNMSFDAREAPPKPLDPNKLTAVIDLDYPKYSAAFVGDRRWIEVVHKMSGKRKQFDNLTAYYGRKGNGGWFKNNNDRRISRGLEPLSIDDFEVIDKNELKDPIENVLYSAKNIVDRAIKASGAEQYIAYHGKGEPDRVQQSTLLKYKGNRDGTLKPTSIDDVTDFLAHKFKSTVVEGIECDDMVVIEAYNKPNYFIIGEDKDFRGSGANFFDVNRPQEGIIETNCFGELWIDTVGKNKKVSGRGFMFLMFQVCSEDKVDNYKANCFSDVKWGSMSAYKALVDCKNEKELLEASIKIFKKLYPEPKDVVGWRGDTIRIDWLYVIKEMYTLAKMLRWKGDYECITEVFDKYGVDYE